MNVDVIVRIKMEPGCEGLFPTKAHSTDAGFDLRSAEDVEIAWNEVKAVSAGFSMEIPEGWEAQVRARSGLAFKYGIMVVNSPGTIDPDYRGIVKVILKNTGNARFESQSLPENFVIRRGDRIAQMVIKPVPRILMINTSDLSTTERGESGLGSTGVK